MNLIRMLLLCVNNWGPAAPSRALMWFACRKEGHWWMAVPSKKLPGSVTSTMLKLDRSGATCMAKVQPQPVPQVRPAVPLPLLLSEMMLKVWGPVTSPHWTCDWRVAVPIPLPFNEISASPDAWPQPVNPTYVACQLPYKSAFEMTPMVALLGFTNRAIADSMMTANRAIRRGCRYHLT